MQKDAITLLLQLLLQFNNNNGWVRSPLFFSMDILEFVKRGSQLTGDVLLQQMSDELLNNDEFIVFLQQQQLSKGENAEGGILIRKGRNSTGTYTPFTEQIARESNPIKPKIAGEPYNFQWTGRFFNSLNIKVFSSGGDIEVQIDSADPKANLLRSEYFDLLGLQDKNQTEVVRFLEKNILKFINTRLYV